MHRLALALASALLSGACIGSGHSLNAYGGTRSLDTSDFGSLDDQTVYGADAVLALELPWLGVEGGWFHAEEDADSLGVLSDVELATDEYFVGLRLTPWHILIEPYASAGVTYVDSELETQGTSDGDEDLAYYARLGAAFRIGIVRIGVDGRTLVDSDVDLENIDSDLDNVQIAAFIGIGL